MFRSMIVLSILNTVKLQTTIIGNSQPGSGEYLKLEGVAIIECRKADRVHSGMVLLLYLRPTACYWLAYMNLMTIGEQGTT